MSRSPSPPTLFKPFIACLLIFCQVFIGSPAALAANQIGEMYAQGTGSLSYMEHKGLHAVVGAGLGAASNLQDPLRGAAGGAAGAVVAEVSAEAEPEFS